MTQNENNTYAWLDAQPAAPKTDKKVETKMLSRMLDFLNKL